jgi:hypothetical protein
MLKPKEAAERAEQFLRDFSPQLPLGGLQLEEVVPFGDNWRVTFSISPPHNEEENTGNIALMLGPRRNYKVVEITATNGDFVSLRNPRHGD